MKSCSKDIGSLLGTTTLPSKRMRLNLGDRDGEKVVLIIVAEKSWRRISNATRSSRQRVRNEYTRSLGYELGTNSFVSGSFTELLCDETFIRTRLTAAVMQNLRDAYKNLADPMVGCLFACLRACLPV